MNDSKRQLSVTQHPDILSNNTRFLADLNARIEASTIVDDSAASGMLVDERNQYVGRALAVVAPSCVEELSLVMSLCHQYRVAVVPQGGNTGYCGGATPDKTGNQLLLSLQRMNQVRELDVSGQSLTAEAGMTLQNVQAAAASENLLFPLSMGSEGSCQIGGNLSTNAGGLAVLRYGTARDLVLGLEVVLPTGQILSELKTLRKDTTGYDLKQLYIGAEGTLGIIAAASLKLFPTPTARFTCWAAVADTEVLPQLLRSLQALLGDAITSFEYISHRSLQLVLDNITPSTNPVDGDRQHFVLVEVSGFGDQHRFTERCTDALLEAQEGGLLEDVVIAQTGVQSKAFWHLRESIPRAEKLLGGSIKHDVSVSVSRISEMISGASAAVSALDSQARLSIYGHVGDGNVHFNILPPVGTAIEAYKTRFGDQISQRVHDVATSLGGSFSAEHGVGQLKTGELKQYSSELRYELMRQIKRSFDPLNLMNPGKLIEN